MGAGGKTLRMLREDAGLSQAELSRIIGTRQSHISEWETGARVPGISTIRKLAEALGCDAAEIVSSIL